MAIKKLYGLLFTLGVVLLTLLVARALWLHYMLDPWTRDARIRAEVINIAPDVSGSIVELPIHDNQLVRQGDLLLRIDPERYRIAVANARADVEARSATLALRRQEAKRRADADSLVVSRESHDQASRAAEIAAAELAQAQAALQSAELDLARTAVYAPRDGYITNLSIHAGDYAHAGAANLALIDREGFWVYGYFEETKLPLVKPGMKAHVTLMSGLELSGSVEGIARGIYDRDNPQSQELIASVKPTFDWVRLAQRIPVRISLDPTPDDVVLAAGASCVVVLDTDANRRPWWILW